VNTVTPEGAPEDWVSILDRLEVGISLAFAGEDLPWEPPLDAGPIPPELAGRARQLLAARLEAEQMLAEQRVTVGRHLDAVNSIPDAPQRTRLLDIRA
jgi:hypothetical protein